MSRIGPVLRETRERKGFTLRKVEEETKIRAKYLEALENDDWIQLPGRVYTLGFLKTYASYLGLEAEPLTNILKEAFRGDLFAEPTRPSPQSKRQPLPNRRRSGTIWPSVLLLFLLVLAFLISYNYINRNTGLSPTLLNDKGRGYPAPGPGANSAPLSEAIPNNSLSPTAPQNQFPKEVYSVLTVNIKASRGDCWLEVWNAGVKEYAGLLKIGEEKVFLAKQELRIKFGDAAAVDVKVNDNEIASLGKPGEVLTKTFRVEEVTLGSRSN